MTKSHSSKMKQLLTIALFALLVLAIVPSALAMTVTVKDLSAEPVSVGVGETVPIVITGQASANFSNVVITAELAYNGKKVDVKTDPFDLIEGTWYTKTLNLKVPENIKVTAPGETYVLTLRVQDNKGTEIDYEFLDVTVQKDANKVEIQKVMTATSAQAGGLALVTIVAKNIGSHELEDVYVKVSITELGLSAEERMGDLAAIDKGEDEDVATVSVPLRIPEDAATGVYTLKVEVYNDDDDVEATAMKSISISGTAPAEKFVEVVPTAVSQNTEQGQTATYNLRVANIGDSAKTFNVFVEGTDGWATATVNPLVVALSPESSQTITVAVKVANNALVGEHAFAVKVISDDAEKEISLTANVQEKAVGIDALLISVIVLAVVLVILIAILVKTRKSSDESEIEESYY